MLKKIVFFGKMPIGINESFNLDKTVKSKKKILQFAKKIFDFSFL